MWGAQHFASGSQMRMIVNPLRACENTVDVFVSSCTQGIRGTTLRPGCTRTKELIDEVFGGALRASEIDCHTADQGEGARRAIDLFVDHAGGRRTVRHGARREAHERVLVAETYDLVIFTRMDVGFVKPVTQWRRANFSRPLFFSQCQSS